MADPITITHIVQSLDEGDIERALLDLLGQGQNLGQQVSVLCLERLGKLAPRAKEMGIPVVCADKRPGLQQRLIRTLSTLLQQLSPNVVHTHQVKALYFAGSAARAAGVNMVVHTEHGQRHAERVPWLASRHAQRFFCVSEELAQEVRDGGVAPAKVRVVPDGIDTVPFRRRCDPQTVRQSLSIPADAPVIGSLGRSTEVDGQDLLVRAFAKIRDRTPGRHLLLVGDGPRQRDLQLLADGLGLHDAIHFISPQLEPQHYLAVMDIFALTSRSESRPLAILQAWAAGVPVVAAAVGGVEALINQGANWLLYPSGDEAALAAALANLLNAPILWTQLSDEAFHEVRTNYDIRHTAAEYDRHYRQLTGCRSRLLRCVA